MKLSKFIGLASQVLEKSGDGELRILLANPSMGPSASSAVKGINAGFDWNSGMIFVSPDEALLSLPAGSEHPSRRFEDTEVLSADQPKDRASTLILKHRSGYVGDHLRTQLAPGDRLRIIKLPASKRGSAVSAKPSKAKNT